MCSFEELNKLMASIESGKSSRNKNYYPLLEAKEYRRFKRAKLLLSIINDINKTSKIDGNQIVLKKGDDNIEIQLFNPLLCYKRKTCVSAEELELIKTRSKELATC